MTPGEFGGYVAIVVVALLIVWCGAPSRAEPKDNARRDDMAELTQSVRASAIRQLAYELAKRDGAECTFATCVEAHRGTYGEVAERMLKDVFK